MNYSDDDFWAQYRRYKRETLPAHDALWAACFGFLNTRVNFFYHKVVDLGAGPDALREESLSLNPSRHLNPSRRFAIDPLLPNGSYTMSASYDDLRTQQPLILPIFGALVTSFFSADVVQSKEDASAVYKRMFDRGVRAAVTSGFYYEGRDENPIKEAGGLTSYQTLFGPEEDPFEVFRCVAKVPSTLFGTDVFEVWRVLLPQA